MLSPVEEEGGGEAQEAGAGGARLLSKPAPQERFQAAARVSVVLPTPAIPSLAGAGGDPHPRLPLPKGRGGEDGGEDGSRRAAEGFGGEVSEGARRRTPMAGNTPSAATVSSTTGNVAGVELCGRFLLAPQRGNARRGGRGLGGDGLDDAGCFDA